MRIGVREKYRYYSPFERIQLVELYEKRTGSMDEFFDQYELNKWSLMQWLRDRRDGVGTFRGKFKTIPPELKACRTDALPGDRKGVEEI